MIWSPKIGDKVLVCAADQDPRKYGWAKVAEICEGRGVKVEAGSRRLFVADTDMMEYWALGLSIPIENFYAPWQPPGRAQMRARG